MGLTDKEQLYAAKLAYKERIDRQRAVICGKAGI